MDAFMSNAKMSSASQCKRIPVRLRGQYQQTHSPQIESSFNLKPLVKSSQGIMGNAHEVRQQILQSQIEKMRSNLGRPPSLYNVSTKNNSVANLINEPRPFIPQPTIIVNQKYLTKTLSIPNKNKYNLPSKVLDRSNRSIDELIGDELRVNKEFAELSRANWQQRKTDVLYEQFMNKPNDFLGRSQSLDYSLIDEAFERAELKEVQEELDKMLGNKKTATSLTNTSAQDSQVNNTTMPAKKAQLKKKKKVDGIIELRSLLESRVSESKDDDKIDDSANKKSIKFKFSGNMSGSFGSSFSNVHDAVKMANKFGSVMARNSRQELYRALENDNVEEEAEEEVADKELSVTEKLIVDQLKTLKATARSPTPPSLKNRFRYMH